MATRAALVLTVTMAIGGGVLAETPRYLWAEIAVPAGAVEQLAGRAERLGIPRAVASAGALTIDQGLTEDALRAGGAYLYLDGPFFLLGVETPSERVVLRGSALQAELVVWASDGLVPPSAAFFDLARELGLLSPGTTISLSVRELSLKLPRVPEGMKLDPTLWALVQHPDWFGAARDFGLERVGLRVRVVAEATGVLSETLEPYVLSSSGSLMNLLIPIARLPELGRHPAVKSVRPPFTPYPGIGG